MRILIIILISLFILCGCTPYASNDTTLPVPDVEQTDIIPSPIPTETVSPEVELPFAFIMEADFDRSQGITIPDYESFNRPGSPIAFDWGEFSEDEYVSGEWTFNDLEEKYGKAIEIWSSKFSTDYIGTARDGLILSHLI